MSKRIGKIAIIAPEPPDTCQFCGAFDELRPYGPKGERICYNCAMKNEKTTERQMRKILFGEKPIQ